MAFREYTFDDIERALKSQNKEYDVKSIEKAFLFGQKAHEGQFRKSGESYFNHPIATAIVIIGLGMDNESIIAALLHDVIEDTEITVDVIRKEFGKDVAMLVESLTKLAKLPFVTREDAQAENIRKMLLAMSEDIRVIIIKLADRLHNMRTISGHKSEDKRRDIAKETLDIYAPIAHRLGIRPVKEELEDLAIQVLDPIAYKDIEDSLAAQQEKRENYLRSIILKIEKKLSTVVPNIRIDGRVKSIHGIYRKMYMQGKTFEEIYDVYAIRIITDTVADCYNILGYIHDMFRPIPGRFKDYISTPKPNMYQSLHSTVLPREAIPFEVQIRTWEMHETAEFGIAAHWKYKSGISKNDHQLDERLNWVRHLLENQQESDNPQDIVTNIKTDLTQDDVFAVTPKGDVINLPVGSCVIDFAYAIHTAVGNKMVGAKVDGRIVPIDYKVKTGEVVEIITTSSPRGPSRDWLNIVKTSEAKAKIRTWFKKEKRPENIERGKAEIERELKRNYINISSEELEETIQKFADKQGLKSIDDFYAAVGYGGILFSRFMPRIKEIYNKAKKPNESSNVDTLIKIKSTTDDGVVSVDGTDNCLIKLSKCCNPLPGDNIIGFVTRGHGISVHKRDCSNVPRDMTKCEDPERWIRVKWTGKVNKNFQSTLTIHAIDRPQMVADVTMEIANMRLALHSISAREIKDGNCVIIINISIESVEHLRNITNRLSKINGVFSIERTGN
ncbi:MAG: bifunctional (p)ppGpp synthetase/guanosine-3',5'-bis(diphosphate) 3'-pyrophosphohydrolase [Clostridia bacterium]|nr:bifunctional (p)ppGpp synthetase/guanosine-3',5'-bis(diphosphate) 3'-pyrophosphohydrolase [Clostridia bacterium]